jgi:hypothetical protein
VIGGRHAIACFAAAVIAAAGLHPVTAQAPSKKKERSVPFAAGETLAYDISWSSYVTAGTATLSVREKKPSYDSVAYYIVAEGRPSALVATFYDLYYKADTLLDAYSLLPQRGSIFSREGKRERMKTTKFNHKANTARYEVQTSTLVKKDLKMPAHSQDPLGTIYSLRAVALKAGDKFSVPICDAGETYTVDISVAAPELVESGIGEVRAWKITPTLPKDKDTGARALTLWISDDARRLPVRMRAQLAVGSFDLTLRSVGK